MTKEIIALVAEPISGQALKSAVGADTAEKGLVEEARERFDKPVKQLVVE
jgi:hypothetical protein